MVNPINYADLVGELQNLRGANNALSDASTRQAALRQRLDSLREQGTSYSNTMTNAYQQMQKRRQMQMEQAAATGGGGRMPGAMSPNEGNYRGGGQVDSWISKALGVLGMGNEYIPGIRTMIMHESGGNPNAINKWDSNWKRGTPSKGLMQTIDPTFNRWKMQGYDNIYDPVANIIAGVRYAQNRYGNDMLRNGGRRSRSGGYIGY